MSDDQVAELMQKVIAGVEARNALIEAAFEATKGTAVAKKMARFEQSGQDCRNDAAIKAMNQLHTLKNQTFNGLCAWMVRILINAIFEHDRRMDVRKTEELLIEPTTDSPSIGTQ